MFEESVTLSPMGLILICIVFAGVGACVAHWVDTRWPARSNDEEKGGDK